MSLAVVVVGDDGDDDVVRYPTHGGDTYNDDDCTSNRLTNSDSIRDNSTRLRWQTRYRPERARDKATSRRR